MQNIQLIATDLDGTFLKEDSTISAKNLSALKLLGKKDIIRVAATGRNMKKVREVIPQEVNFEYIVYSSGAGVYDWKNQQEVDSQNIDKDVVHSIYDYLINEKINFHSFFPAPNNHKNWYHRSVYPCNEFERYIDLHAEDAIEFPQNRYPNIEVCQLLVIVPNDETKFSQLKENIESISNHIRIIRATSPLKTGYIWIEVFHYSVSKGEGIKKICKMLNIDKNNTVGIGNDYNDIDMLNFTANAFITFNAPQELRNQYKTVPSNEDDAFAHVVDKLC